jgi:hypothetical protein
MTEPPENEAPPIPTKKPEAKANSGPNIADSLGPANSFPVQCASHGADGITRTERQDLLRLHRQAVKVAKIAVAQRGDSLRADFERQLAANYSFNQDPIWKKAYRDAEEVVAEAQRQIAECSRVLNIPERFAPSIAVSWYRRGENAFKERCAELRRVAYSQIEALEKSAVQEVERRSLSARRLERFSRTHFGTVIIDEAHHAPAESYQRILAHLQGAKLLGVTATPDRGDLRSLGNYFDDVSFEISLVELIKGGYLCPIKVQTVPVKIDLSGVSVRTRRFQRRGIGRAARAGARRACGGDRGLRCQPKDSHLRSIGPHRDPVRCDPARTWFAR